VLSELGEISVENWQRESDQISKGAITKRQTFGEQAKQTD
jgi:hypothetical protein